MKQGRILAEYTAVAAIAVGLLTVTEFHRPLQQLATAVANVGLAAAVASALVQIASFVTLFRVGIAIYYRWLWRHVNAQTYLGGHWTFVYNATHVPPGLEEITPPTVEGGWDPEGDEYGLAYFDHSVESLAVFGESFGLVIGKRRDVGATWESTAAAVVGLRVNVTVDIRSARGSREGYVILHIVPSRSRFGLPQQPELLLGHYHIYEGGPARSYARVMFHREGTRRFRTDNALKAANLAAPIERPRRPKVRWRGWWPS